MELCGSTRHSAARLMCLMEQERGMYVFSLVDNYNTGSHAFAIGTDHFDTRVVIDHEVENSYPLCRKDLEVCC